MGGEASRDIKSLAPRCFGLPSAFSDSPTCGACGFSKECDQRVRRTNNQVDDWIEERDARKSSFKEGTLNVKRKTKLGGLPNVDLRRRQTVAHFPTEKVVTPKKIVTTAAGLSPGAGDLHRDILGPIGWMLKHRENPFTGKERGVGYMNVVCRELLKGGFTRDALAGAMKRELYWSDSVFAKRYQAVTEALVFMRAIEDQGGTWKLKEA